MIPVVSFVGKSNAGKTTLLEKVILLLKQKGYRIATVKHNAHEFEMDRPGKDTWRHAKAGADTVIIAAPTKLALIRRLERPMSLDEILAMVDDVDLIITEGYKRGDKPKIEVFRSEVCEKLLCCADDKLIAVASDVKLEREVPCFDLNDAAGITGFIEETFLTVQR
ncbi:MAG: molybdopterin-guanine dinucleotide biosynthesis protein B [bacterium]|jgi:molybdopterin-guanine dinucleotide biosynthesis protein MobB